MAETGQDRVRFCQDAVGSRMNAGVESVRENQEHGLGLKFFRFV